MQSLKIKNKENICLDNYDKIYTELVSLIKNSNSNKISIILPLNEKDFYNVFYLYSLSQSLNTSNHNKEFPRPGDNCYIEPFNNEIFIFHNYVTEQIPQVGQGMNQYFNRIYISDVNSKEINKHLLNEKNKIVRTNRSAPKGNSKFPSFKNKKNINKLEDFFKEEINYNFENLTEENIFLINRNKKHNHLDFLDTFYFQNDQAKKIYINEFPLSFINKKSLRTHYKYKDQIFDNATVFEYTNNLKNLELANHNQTLFVNNINSLVNKDTWVDRFTQNNKIILFIHPNQINQINLIKKQNFHYLLYGNDRNTENTLINSNTNFEKSISKRISDYKEFDYNFVKYIDSDFDKICNLYFELTKDLKNFGEEEREILSKLTNTIFRSNDLIDIENNEKFKLAKQSIQIFSEILEIKKFDLDTNKISSFEKINSLIKEFFKKNIFFENKIMEINEFLRINNQDTLVIIPNNFNFNDQLKNKYPNCTFLTLKNILNKTQDLPPFESMLVCCYIKRDYLHKVIFSQLSKKITFLCNNFEHNFYKKFFSKKAWLELVKFDSNNNEKINIFGEKYETISSKDKVEQSLDDDKMRLVNLDELLDRPIFESYQSNEEQVIPILLKFQCGGMAYFYQNHDYKIINQEKDEKFEISKINSSNFQYDDIIIIRNTGDKVIYEEETKRISNNEENEVLKKNSEKWKNMLENKFNTGQGFDTDDILFQLQKIGFKKTRNTLQNWLYGDVYCPEEYSDLILINKICDSRYSDKELREVYNSAQLIRSKHQSVGRDLTKRIFEQTVNIFNDNIFNIHNDRIRVDIDKNGSVQLGGDNSENPEGWVLKIDTVRTVNFSVPISHVNRLYIP